LNYRHFKSKINKSTSVWPWNVGQRSYINKFLNSLGMSSDTLAILFIFLKPIVKKLFSIKMSIDSWNRNWKNISHRNLPWTNLRKDLLGIALTVLKKKIFKDLTMFFGIWPKFDLVMKVKVKYYDWFL
jgi:hypothetical protein